VGADVIDAGGGADTIDAAAAVAGDSGSPVGSGNDGAADQVDAGPGNDIKVAGGDVVHGGDGADTITGAAGADTIDAGAGAAVIRAVDGERDAVSCGGGADDLAGDAIDAVAADCELIAGGAAPLGSPLPGPTGTPGTPGPTGTPGASAAPTPFVLVAVDHRLTGRRGRRAPRPPAPQDRARQRRGGARAGVEGVRADSSAAGSRHRIETSSRRDGDTMKPCAGSLR
jgi:hypothetical protein